jgi:hypothetical protein
MPSLLILALSFARRYPAMLQLAGAKIRSEAFSTNSCVGRNKILK